MTDTIDKTIKRSEFLCPFQDCAYPSIEGWWIVVSRQVADATET